MEKTVNPTLSVVICSYNCKKYIEACVKSVLAQSYTDFEVLLVDSESTDGSGELCRILSEKHPQIRFYSCKNVGDASGARNLAISEARGKYITFVDGDDVIDKDMYAVMVGETEKENLDAVYCSCYRFFNDDLSTKSCRDIRETLCQSKAEIAQIMLPKLASGLDGGFEVTGSMCMTVYRLDIIRENNLKVKPMKEIYSEDNFFNIQFLCCARRVKTINKPFYYYRKNLSSVTNTPKEYTVPALLNFARLAAEQTKKAGGDGQAVENAARLRLIVTYSAVTKQKIDSCSLGEVKNWLRNNQKKYPVDYSFTEGFNGMPLQVKLFWGLMKYKMYTPLYLLVKVYSRLVTR